MRLRLLSRPKRSVVRCCGTRGRPGRRQLAVEPLEDRRLLDVAGLSPMPTGDRILFVDADAPGSNDGTSWTDAYNDLQDALAAAAAGDEIRVAGGVYTPDEPGGDRAATFQLVSGVIVSGGYGGFGKPDPDARDLQAYETILSGDLNGDDGPEFAGYEENSYNVLTGTGTGATAVLDGLTISGGNANGATYEDTFGGGLCSYDESSPTLINCTFLRNRADARGGGMYTLNGSPALTGCTFIGNTAESGGGMFGYGAALSDCTFHGNSGVLGGGVWGSADRFSRCVFIGNTAGSGGGIFAASDSELVNCVLSGNSAGSGGAIYAQDCDLKLTNCSVGGNTASDDYGGFYCDEGDTLATNCVFWANRDSSGSGESAQLATADPATVNYSCIQGWTGALGGTGNFGDDPMLVDPDGAEDVVGTPDDDLHLLSGSPCIDAGDNAALPPALLTDLDGNPRIVGEVVDMGAYEFQGPFVPEVLYVDADAGGNNDGTSWQDAFVYLQDALSVAAAHPVVEEIRVAQGLYTPDQGASQTPGDREATFQLIDGVSLLGGYAGFGAVDPDARNIDAFRSVLSGDLTGNDVAIADPFALNNDPSRTENSFHVVTGSGTGPTAVLDGFTITGGRTEHAGQGGGVLNFEGSPTLLDCTLALNVGGQGGGMYNGGDTTPSNPTLINCTVSGNWGIDCGGGVYNAGSNPTLINCALVGNRAEDWGGGGMFNGASSPTLTNCTIIGNWASDGGSGIYNSSSNPILTNCILWGNLDDQITVYGDSDPVITYSVVEGDWDDTGNIDADPLMIDADGPDDIFGTPDDDLRLLSGSPCIDAGDNAALPPALLTDLDGNPRFVDDPNTPDTGHGTPPIVDMGAYEFQPPRTIFVDDDALHDPLPGDPSVSDPSENGSQSHPFDAIQEAIDAAEDGDTVLVLDGTYTGEGNRDIGFLGKAITVRSDSGPGSCVIDCQQAGRAFSFGGRETRASVLDGLTIRNGLADEGGAIACRDASSPTIANCAITGNRAFDTAMGGGGGILIEGSSPLIADCTLRENSAPDGGAIAACRDSVPVITCCTITGNEAFHGGAWGGGIYCLYSNAVISHCTISDNQGGNGGGIASDYDCETLISHCTISGNTAWTGGGIGCYEDNATIEYCTIADNVSTGSGGGIHTDEVSTATITNCILAGNTADRNGGGIYRGWFCETAIANCTIAENSASQGGGYYSDWYGDGSIANSILWGNEGADVHEQNPGVTTIAHSCIEGGWAGIGNIDADPMFVEPPGANYRLLPGSPCINAGDNAAVPAGIVTDLDGNPRIIGGTVDMGAYEHGASLPVDHFEISTITSPQQVGTPFQVTIIARDASGQTVTDFSGAVDLSGWMETGTSSTVVISEVDAASPDTAEFTNVSGGDVDISGWHVLIYDRNTGTSPQPAWTIPAGTICAAGDVFVVEQDGTSPGTYPHFYLGSGVSWRTYGSIGVLLLDAAGQVADFMAAGDLDPGEISQPVTIVPDHWQGDQLPALPDYSVSYQRTGQLDHDNAGDWVLQPSSLGGVNPGLTLPFGSELSRVEIAPATTGAFADGVWSGQITVWEQAAGMFLRAGDVSQHLGHSNLFDVRIPPGEIRGSKWFDVDRDGHWDDGEPGLAGWKIYLDLNDNGHWEEDEPYDWTDADGHYAIAGLSPGTYVVAEVGRPGWQQSYPDVSGQLPTGLPGEPASAPSGWAAETPSPTTPSFPAACEPLEVDTAWIDGPGPSALANLDPQVLYSASPPQQTPFSGSGTLGVYVEPGLLSTTEDSLSAYANDLSREGYQVFVEEFSGTAEQLRSELHHQWSTNALEGALLVGDLPYVIFTSEDNYHDRPSRVSYPHDLYFMDLDGSYVFHPEGLDEHVAGSGDVGPEIYVSRITTGNLGGVTGLDEATLINRYFGKVHDYRRGRLSYENRGVVFVDDDWDHWNEWVMQGLYSEILVVNDPAETTKQGYLDTLQLNYESIMEALHSGSTGHSVRVGGSSESITNREILEANPRPGFYNMFNCSSARFTTANYLAGVYVYGGDYGLSAVGTTKTGGMLSFPEYYRPQGAGDSVGQAFLQWFDLNAVGTDTGPDSSVDWFYGMTMQGDPTLRPASMPGNPIDTHFVHVESGQTTPDVDFGNHTATPASVVDRHVFYNDSAFDGNDPASGPADDQAIAIDKQALLPGTPTGIATRVNYTSYSRGINGIMIDVSGLPDDYQPTVAEFQLKVGNNSDPATWQPAPDPISVTFRPDKGTDDSDRITIIWADGAIRRQWLEVTVLASKLALTANDVFYFGNAPGEAGGSEANAMVNMTDEVLVRSHLRTPRDPAPIDDPYDFNRDRLVNVTDRIIARTNRTSAATALQWIAVPGAGGGTPDSEAGSDPDRVLQRAVREDSQQAGSSLGKLAWLADLDFAQTAAQKRTSGRGRAAARAVDALLATCAR